MDLMCYEKVVVNKKVDSRHGHVYSLQTDLGSSPYHNLPL
jgi:hypothetical protein